ncbi:MAG: hypothetical protein ABJE95_29555 [Byssovorax sp.]
MIDLGSALDGGARIAPTLTLSAAFSLVFAGSGALAFAGLVGHALVAAARHRRMATAAKASFQPDRPYVAGEIVLHGRVATADGATLAVRVEVDQDGTETESSGVWSHAWTEVSRRIFVEPFYLVDAAGRRTRVEPPDDVLLVDAMDGKIMVNLARRTCSAELTPGEEVWAAGVLVVAPDPEGPAHGYRGPSGLVLKAPPSRRMLLSSEPLGARFEAKARFFRRWSALLGLAGALVWATVFGPYLLRAVAGETRSATITLLEPYDTDDDGHVTHHYRVLASVAPTEPNVDDDVHEETFRRLQVGQSIVVRWVPSMPQVSTLGPDAAVGRSPLVILFWGLWVVSAIIYRSRIHASMGWYEKKVVDKGSGKLGF